jgi:hypothetical protein
VTPSAPLTRVGPSPAPSASRRRIVFVSVAATLAGALASCAGVGGPPKVTLSAAEIEALVKRQFPMDRRMLDLFDVTINAPSIQLLPERNRLAAVVDMKARSPLFAGGLQGQLSLDSALRWEPADQTLRLLRVRVQDLLLDNSNPLARTAAQRMGGAVAERILEDMVLYTLPAERAAQMAALGVQPSAVTVTSRGVEISFESAAKDANKSAPNLQSIQQPKQQPAPAPKAGIQSI